MRVVVISAAFPPLVCPESDHTVFVCRCLAERGLEVQLITSAGADAQAAGAFTVHRIGPDWSWRTLPKLLALIRTLKPDAILLIHLGWVYKFHPMIAFLPTFCRRVVPSARFVTQFENIQLHDTRWSKLLARLLHLLPRPARFFDEHLGTLLSASQRVICLSARHRDIIAARHPRVAQKSAVIAVPPIISMLDDPDGSLREEGRARLGIARDEILLAFFGFLYASKGIETLLPAVATVLRTRPLKLLLIGQISEPDYGRMLDVLEGNLGLRGRIIWSGHCEPDEASALLRAADVGVFPFDVGVRLNNSSFAYAASHGLPIIAAAGPDVETPFHHGSNVWLCPPRHPEALAEAIERLAGDQDLRRHLGAGARRLSEESFSRESAIAATLEALT